MRIITCNVNGIRAAHKKGFWEWCRRQKPDVVCLQEVRADEDKIPDLIREPKGYHAHFVPAQKSGYSGVAILSRHEPVSVKRGLGEGWSDFDAEGRYIQYDFEKVSVVSVYFPSGTSSEERQQAKYSFLDRFYNHMNALKNADREVIFCGDFNIAHKNEDLKNWRSNQRNSGFLPEERAWMDRIFDELGYVDAFREVNKEADQYTWWSNRGRAYEKNVGWRIDYQVTTPGLRDKIKNVSIYKRKKFSDHAPLIIDYDLH